MYGNTVATLDYKTQRTVENAKKLKDDPAAQVAFSIDKPVRYSPFPDYNGETWIKSGHAPFVPCKGPTGAPIEDLLVFKGRPHDFPDPLFGSYKALNMDPNICWERDTRLGMYGLQPQLRKVGNKLDLVSWDLVNWGDLQKSCARANAARFPRGRPKENQFSNTYPDLASNLKSSKSSSKQNGGNRKPSKELRSREDDIYAARERADKAPRTDETKYIKEKRTAILLRSYSNKKYTENDKQVIRAMISEVSLRSGGQYEVFILMHVKEANARIFESRSAYQKILDEQVPQEFHGITVLWNDELVWDIYTELTDEEEKKVHTAQWLSVQKFSHDHPEFDYIWNWEMDFRYTGHHFDLLDNIDKFARQQPRKGSWERNDRWYIPEYHGDYDTTFRHNIAETYGDDMVWGPPNLSFINPVGPKPPVSKPSMDNHEWGVGEDADIITVGPMFDPIHSNWIIGTHVWGYNSTEFDNLKLPRRSTIVTQSRLSKRLLDIMHIENMRGNHVASEMTPQTVALLHGLKAIQAPHPVFMDRNWNGEFLNKWFNPGPKGTAGSYGSPMGWGRERRYQGTTWYYRAEPPNRLYNNWMGWADTGIGGPKWEQTHGRACLPSMMLHPIKDSQPTDDDHVTGFELWYG